MTTSPELEEVSVSLRYLVPFILIVCLVLTANGDEQSIVNGYEEVQVKEGEECQEDSQNGQQEQEVVTATNGINGNQEPEVGGDELYEEAQETEGFVTQ